MGRYTGPRCRICRREGMKLFLKGERCFKASCALERREYAPGQHGQSRVKVTEYGVRLREKQKLRRIYGLTERPFQRFFREAERHQGVTGQNLLQFLERRLDNAVFRLGFASSRPSARQLVRHGHVRVNGKDVSVPGRLLRAGDVISLRNYMHENPLVKESLQAVSHRGVPAWLELKADAYEGVVKALPSRDDAGAPVNEQLIVEFYSR